MNPPRVLYTAFDVFPSPKGSSTHMAHIIQGLVQAGYAMEVLTPGTPDLPPEESLYGAQVIRLPGGESENFLQRAVQFGQEVLEYVQRSQPYQIVHYRSLWDGLLLAENKAHFGYKTLFEVNGLPSIELKYHYPALAGSPLLEKIRAQEIAALALSDAIFCPSEITRLFLLSLGASPKKVSVIPNGVSPNDFPLTPLPARSPERPPVLLYIGTLADWQGLEIVIHAMPAILASQPPGQPPPRLRIVGRGRSRQRKTLAKQVQKMGLADHISIEEAVPHHQVAALLAEADICLAPLTLNDRNVTQGCCPLKILEYMAAGRPLVASNLPVVRELLREGVDGLLFAPDNPADLARHVGRLLADETLAGTLSASAAAHVRQSFTWHRAQKKLLKLYKKLAPCP